VGIDKGDQFVKCLDYLTGATTTWDKVNITALVPRQFLCADGMYKGQCKVMEF